jgi:hypothetical protein
MMFGLLPGLSTGLLMATGATTEAPSCLTADPRVEAVISAKAHELGGSEYCQYRQYETLSDLDGDGKDDFVVVFGIEGSGGGGNSVTQYLAVFGSASAWTPRVVKCGERGERLVESIKSVSNREVVLAIRPYRPKDPMCCPSGHATVTFRLEGEKLVETPGTPARTPGGDTGASGSAHPRPTAGE